MSFLFIQTLTGIKKNICLKANKSLICDMEKYYSTKLSAEKLMKCYETAPLRIRQYLNAETDYVLKKINAGNSVLELGCGYGRILTDIAKKARIVVGIDTSLSSIEMGRKLLSGYPGISLMQMDATRLEFKDSSFDAVVCIQNGISAFQTDKLKLIKESIRVSKPGGIILFSSYLEKFWDERLKWFELQAEKELIGEIDYSKTKNGTIVCKDGFSAGTVGATEFKALVSEIKNIRTKVSEIDNSSIFFEIIPDKFGTFIKAAG